MESAASDISRYESASSVIADVLPATAPEAVAPASLQQPAAPSQLAPAAQRRSANVTLWVNLPMHTHVVCRVLRRKCM